jgi:hypothetical protein
MDMLRAVLFDVGGPLDLETTYERLEPIPLGVRAAYAGKED